MPEHIEKCVAVNKAGRSQRSEERFDSRHGDAEFRVCPAGSLSCVLLQYLFTMSHFLSFGKVMCILSHCMLKVWDLLFFIIILI